jgi:hypothetical protein
MGAKLLGVIAARFYLGLCFSFAFFGLMAPASATHINISYTGLASGGTINCAFACFQFTDNPFTLTYTFDTSLAPPASYTNNGSSSQLSANYIYRVGYSSFVFPCVAGDSNNCDPLTHEIDQASLGSTYSQSIFDYRSESVRILTTSLFANPAIPGDIAEPFSLSGTDIGDGSFQSAGLGIQCDRGGCLTETLQIQSIVVTSDETPLPATLPLFATGLGALGLLGWRRKRKAVQEFTTV